jgi:hypothetical protein
MPRHRSRRALLPLVTLLLQVAMVTAGACPVGDCAARPPSDAIVAPCCCDAGCAADLHESTPAVVPAESTSIAPAGHAAPLAAAAAIPSALIAVERAAAHAPPPPAPSRLYKLHRSFRL